MSSREPQIISFHAPKFWAKAPSAAQSGDWHDVIGHHRYYGSSAIAGEPIAESRRGQRPVNLCGF
jgi:hypothetical protein